MSNYKEMLSGVIYSLKQIHNESVGRIDCQDQYEELQRISFEGLGIGRGSSVKESGEMYVINHIRSKESKITLIDAGANTGEYTEAFLSLFGNDANIIGFEPYKKVYDLYSDKFSNRSNVFPLNMALGEKRKDIKLYTFCDTERSSNIKLGKHEGEEIVSCTTIDNFTDGKLVLPIFLKMDVEGSELNILKGAERSIQEGIIKYIQFEFGGCSIHAKTYIKDFFDILYDKYFIYRVTEKGMHHLVEYHEKYEQFLVTNYYAELKQ